MSVETVTDVFALILLGGAIGLGAMVFRPAGRAWVAESWLELAGAVAVGATAGSLYLSEVAHFVPCELCWFQRIAMYPMAIILPTALVDRDRRVVRYTLPLAGIGLVISLYHVQLQTFPEQSSFCELANPCTSTLVEALGFMTIPQMSAVSFALLLGLLGIGLRTPDRRPTSNGPPKSGKTESASTQ